MLPHVVTKNSYDAFQSSRQDAKTAKFISFLPWRPLRLCASRVISPKFQISLARFSICATKIGGSVQSPVADPSWLKSSHHEEREAHEVGINAKRKNLKWAGLCQGLQPHLLQRIFAASKSRCLTGKIKHDTSSRRPGFDNTLSSELGCAFDRVIVEVGSESLVKT
jgi:hypothetical protein